MWPFIIIKEPSFDPAIPRLDLYPKNLKLAYYSDKTTSIFIAAQLTIVKLWNQPRFPSVDEWIKKLWYVYTMGYYSALKKNEIMAFAGKWMELENIMLSKISKSQKSKAKCFL
ncbi:hypothetical protein H1C71_015933 [Ictidomys tridecemlineatus]|nr:hypothetical protein H1C71_015933 [Ictidomys tridecemlineatus]